MRTPSVSKSFVSTKLSPPPSRIPSAMRGPHRMVTWEHPPSGTWEHALTDTYERHLMDTCGHRLTTTRPVTSVTREICRTDQLHWAVILRRQKLLIFPFWHENNGQLLPRVFRNDVTFNFLIGIPYHVLISFHESQGTLLNGGGSLGNGSSVPCSPTDATELQDMEEGFDLPPTSWSEYWGLQDMEDAWPIDQSLLNVKVYWEVL